MASGTTSPLPLTTVQTSNGHSGRRSTAVKACFCFLLLLLLVSVFLACDTKHSRVAFQRMYWWLKGDYHDRLRFDAWMKKYKPDYSTNSAKADRKFLAFRDNLRYVEKQNANPNHTYRLGLNVNADYAYEQAPPRSRLALSSFLEHASDQYLAAPSEEIPVAVDWRRKGAVGPVREQLDCGSCWAVAAVEAMEGSRQIATAEDLVPLSVQEVIDCNDANYGCAGGRPEKAMEYAIKYGLHTETEYPYVGEKKSCRKLEGATGKIAIYEAVPGWDERSLQKAVAAQPVAVPIDFVGRDLMLYESGVYNGPCGRSANHVVLVVGYGSEGGKDYWIVKNSWGEGWGDGGYMKMERNLKGDAAGKCGIAMEPIYSAVWAVFR